MSIIIDGKECTFTPGQTVYEVARANGVPIPVLCHQEQLKPVGACRVCVVEVQGARSLVVSCSMPAEKGMVITTNSARVLNARRLAVELLLTQGHHNCLVCESSGDCVLQSLAYSLGIDTPRFPESTEFKPLEQGNEMIVRDMNKCILCGLCVRACNEIQVNQVLDFSGRGPTATVGPAFGTTYEDSNCVFCGECVRLCPVGAIFEKQGRFKSRAGEARKVRTTCEYCGVGCQMELNVKGNKVVKVTTPGGMHPHPTMAASASRAASGMTSSTIRTGSPNP